MFSRSARYYDRLYGWKDYAGESERLVSIIRSHLASASTVLDVACGTGTHLSLLRHEFAVEGLEIDPELLEIAKAKCPGIRLHRGDMRKFDLGRQFDVVTCLFSSIGYLRSVAELRDTLSNFSRHLSAGGLAIVEPWFAPKQWQPGHLHLLTVDDPDLKVVRMNAAGVEERVAILNFEYLVGEDGRIEHFRERHEMFLFTNDEYREAIESAGLDVEHDAEGLMGRGLWIGRRR